ncbi:MAG: SAV_2336 N-terminal domain-related protein, partial [Acidobacteriota bacterium]
MATGDSRKPLADALDRLQKSFPQYELMPREVLEVLWLAERLGTVARSSPRPPSPAPPVRPSASEHMPERPMPAEMERGSSGQPRRRNQSDRPRTVLKPTRAEADLHARTATIPSEEARLPALLIRVPAAPLLRNAGRIARALRPLTKRIPARSAMVRDEVATADHSAEQRLLQPVMRPATTRWLDLALVVDRAGSTRFWSRSIDELRSVLEHHSAFRSVRCWNLVEEDAGPARPVPDPYAGLSLRTWSNQSRRADPLELVDPSGRQLIVVVSDCVSLIWSDGRMVRLMQSWASRGPVSIFQLLPEEMWARTSLRFAQSTRLRATNPGAPNASLLVDDGDEPHQDLLRIPVTSMDRNNLSAWASVIAATGGLTVPGVLFSRNLPGTELVQRARRTADVRAA